MIPSFTPSFEYSALRYLLLWNQRERDIYNGLKSNPSPSTVRLAMHHFRISRGFPNLAQAKVAKWIIAAVDAVDSQVSPVLAVPALALRFERKFGSFNLSAASKLLWWKYRSPYLIYDSRAAKALGAMVGYKYRDRDYEEYVSAWRSAQRENRKSIEKAIAVLPSAGPFLKVWHPNGGSIASLASEQWFQDRVFDLYLWELGGNE